MTSARGKRPSATTRQPDKHRRHDPYEAESLPRVSRSISFESKRVLKAEVGAGAICDLADWFEAQWAESRDFKQDLIDLLDTSKFGTVEYTPYQVYLKALFEFFRADLEAAGGVPADLYSLDLAEFQSDAVERARRILAKYDGVMVCDAVGLGKTWIGLQLLLDFAYHRRWHALIICPAALRPCGRCGCTRPRSRRRFWAKSCSDARTSTPIRTASTT